MSSGLAVPIPSKETNSPLGTESGRESNSTFSSPSLPPEAAKSIAMESTPRILAGFRLVMTTTFLPINSLEGILPASPATTVRGSAASPVVVTSPQSTLQISKLSASGWGPAFNIVAALSATLLMSSSVSLSDGSFWTWPPPRFRCSSVLTCCCDVPHASRRVTTRLKIKLSIPVESWSRAKYPDRSNW